MFPQRLDSPLAYDIAKAMMDGFNRHYQLFRTESARAKHRFETADCTASSAPSVNALSFMTCVCGRHPPGWSVSSKPESKP